MLSMSESIVDTIGLTLMGFLCILVRKYISDVLSALGGEQYSAILGDSSPLVLNSPSVLFTVFIMSNM